MLPRSALVLGLARQGTEASLALARRGVRVVGVDRSRDVDSRRLRVAGVEVHLGSEEQELLAGIDVVVKSGGVPTDSPLASAALARAIPIWSDVEVGYRILPNPILGVTGTNGKTTTSALLGAILEREGRLAAVAGNIGLALCALDGQVPADGWVVCELSSFQLEHVHTFRPRVAVLLNVEPDHLDRHGTWDAYRDTKLRIFENQEADDAAVVPTDFGSVPGDARRIEFSPDDALPAELLLVGRHNRANAAAATSAARAAGVSEEAIAHALGTFPGVPHRLELVRDLRGVRFVNDSKATNTGAARRAVDSYTAPLHVILGGRGKGEQYDALAAVLARRAERSYLIGEEADALASALERAGAVHHRCGDLDHAVAAAASAARRGDVVLLAPACASYDQYASFEERGDHFRRLVEELA